MAVLPDVEPDCVVPRHNGEWTVDEILQLPEDNGSRVELVDGALIVSPAPTWQHQRILQALQRGLWDAVGPDAELSPGINIRLGQPRLLIPDLAVVTCPGQDFVYGTAADLLLAIEIESPSTKVHDRVLKRQLYADAEVPYYLLVNPAAAPIESTLYELRDEEYHEITRSAAGKLTLTRPFAAIVDLGG